MKKTCAMVAVAGLAAGASADIYGVMDGPAISFETASLRADPGVQTTDGFFLVPGVGNDANGFALTGGPFAESTFDGASEDIGNDVNGATITSNDTTLSGDVFQPGNSVFQITLSSSGGDVWPDGLVVGGVPADRGGIFLGANAGGNPLDFVAPTIVNEVIVFALDANGDQILGSDVTQILTDFQTDPNGFWDGSLGIAFGAVSTGLGAATIGYQFDVTVTPAPTSMAVLGLGGLVAARRRR